MSGVDVTKPCERCGGRWHVASPAYSHSGPHFAHYCHGSYVGGEVNTPEALAMAAQSSALSAANALLWGRW